VGPHWVTPRRTRSTRKLALQSESAPGAPLLDLCLVLRFRSNDSASYTVVVMGPLHADANPIGLGSRRRAVRACARSATHHAPRSAARAPAPRAESSGLHVGAHLRGRRDIKDIQDVGREAAASRMQREAGRALAPALPSSTLRSFFCGSILPLTSSFPACWQGLFAPRTTGR
jgi:hypothetical protein